MVGITIEEREAHLDYLRLKKKNENEPQCFDSIT